MDWSPKVSIHLIERAVMRRSLIMWIERHAVQCALLIDTLHTLYVLRAPAGYDRGIFDDKEITNDVQG